MSAPRISVKTSCRFGGALASHGGRRVANSRCLIALRDVTGRRVFDDRLLRHENSGYSTRSSAMADHLGLCMSRFRPGLATGGAARMSSFLL
jgi:hypothetical protein